MNCSNLFVLGIIGGRESEPHSRPYQVIVSRDGRQGCSGAILSSQWVVTTADCVEETDHRYSVT